MTRQAMGFIETVGYASALIAADYALKAAKVSLLRMETVIGVGKSIGVTVFFAGDVAAVQAAIDAAKAAVAPLATVVAAHVIANIDAKARDVLIDSETLQ